MNEIVEIFPSERQKLYERFAGKIDLNKIESHAIHFNHTSITRDAFPDDTEIASLTHPKLQQSACYERIN